MAYPPVTASPYRKQTGKAASTSNAWSLSNNDMNDSSAQFRELRLPYSPQWLRKTET